MINKIGISTFNEDNISSFGHRNYNEIIAIDEKMEALKKIHNIIIDSEVIMQKVIKNLVVITMFFNVKIIYTTQNEETLYVLKKSLIKSIKVKIPSEVSEDIISKIENKFIKAEIYIYDVNCNIQCERTLDLSIFITASFQSLNEQNLLLLLAFDNLKPNLYDFHTNTREITQKTYYLEENIMAVSCDKDILYIKEYNSEYFLCEIINESIVETLLPYEIQNPINISKISNNTYIIIWKKYNEFIISKLENGRAYIKFRRVINEDFLPIYNAIDNKVIYINEENGSLNLIYCDVEGNKEFNNEKIDFRNESLNLKNQNLALENGESLNNENINVDLDTKLPDFNNDFKFADNSETIITGRNLKKYNVSYFGNYIAYSLEEEFIDNLFIYSLKTGDTREVNFPINNYKIKNITFSNKEDLLIINLEVSNCENIYIYNIEKRNLNKITRNIGETIVSSIYINNINNCIYVSQNEGCDFNLYIIALNNFEVKDIIYLNAKEIEIITKN